MSRIGNKVLTIPAGVTVDLQPGNVLTVKGPKGELKDTFNSELDIKIEDNQIKVSRPNDQKQMKMIHGTTTALIQNMLVGVTDGYKIELEIQGVGYRANLQGKKLVMNLGYSHPIEMEIEEGVTLEVPSQTSIIVSGINKQRVGEVAAIIRGHRRPEPYKGKGIRYKGEYVRRKEGKTAAKK